jgi:hypothetical protein
LFKTIFPFLKPEDAFELRRLTPAVAYMKIFNTRRICESIKVLSLSVLRKGILQNGIVEQINDEEYCLVFVQQWKNIRKNQ